MVTTNENLAQAFAGESQANRKYLAFSAQAEKDGWRNVAKLFKAAAEAETVHALAHLRAMGGVKTTAENLQAAFDGETYEYVTMYPPMVALAAADKHKAEGMFRWAAAAEEAHARLYEKALAAVKAGRDLEADGVYVCPVCGNVILGKPTAPCAVCGAAPGKFRVVE